MNTERWDYKIDGKQHGVMRILIVAGIMIFFGVLAVDQLVPGENKYWQLALLLASPAVISAGLTVRLVIRYFCFKIYVGRNGFYLQTNPFNGKYYRYSQIKGASEELKKYRRRSHGTSYVYYFNIRFKNGTTKSIIFEKALHEREFRVLRERINCFNNIRDN